MTDTVDNPAAVTPGEPVRGENAVITETATLRAANRTALLAAVDAWRSVLGYLTPDAEYLFVGADCGATRAYVRREDVPSRSDRCPCRKVPHPHYFIRYA